eukprot:8235449-Prorocentrum_lima.AAC.1
MTSSLVGSEMCIRDRENSTSVLHLKDSPFACGGRRLGEFEEKPTLLRYCLLYTSDAADDM